MGTGLDTEVASVEDPKEAKKALMKVMEHIRDVRLAMDTTQEIFQPLQDILVNIKSHGVDLGTLPKIADKPVQDYLDEAPLMWDRVVKKSFRKKEEILPMQTREVEALKQDLESFFQSVRNFRGEFRTKAPFTFEGQPLEAYIIMDTQAFALETKEDEAREKNSLEELFELQVSKYPEMGDTRSELRLLKTVWDGKALVFNIHKSWNSQLWNDIKTDDLEDVNKNLLKNLRKMANENPVVKGWTVYRSIEDAIKNMGVVLPLINSLHSPAMRDRHWKNLARLCNVKSIDPNDPKFTFEDAIDLKVTPPYTLLIKLHSHLTTPHPNPSPLPLPNYPLPNRPLCRSTNTQKTSKKSSRPPTKNSKSSANFPRLRSCGKTWHWTMRPTTAPRPSSSGLPRRSSRAWRVTSWNCSR